jgi:hypothetical protein
MNKTALLPLLLLLSSAPGAAQPQPPAPPPPEQPPADAGAPPDLEALRKEYFRLRDSLFRSRARAAAMAGAMYSSRLQVRLHHASGRFQSIARASIRLDGASVYEDTEGAIAEADATRFEGWIAPGRHQLTIRIEAAGKDDQRFTTAVEDSFVVEAVAGRDLVVRATASDGGDIAYAWQRKQHGSYKLHLDVDVEAVTRPEAHGH